MTTDVLTAENSSLSAVSAGTLDELAGITHDYVAAAKAPATLRAYRSDWRLFDAWCADHGLTSMPATPETIALWLTDFAGVLACATLQRRLTSISQAHKAAGHDSPTRAPLVQATWQGIRRTFGTATRGKAPAVTPILRAFVTVLDIGRLGGLRNRALLVVGFAGAFRRSELVALDVADVVETIEGLEVTIRRSKTDQDGEGVVVCLPYGSDPSTCPVRTLKAWLTAAGIADGPIFRPVNRWDVVAGRRLSPRAVADVVKATAAAAGHDPSEFAAHSLRAGLITSAAGADVAERDIMRHSRHRSERTMRRYIRDASRWRANAAMAVGL